MKFIKALALVVALVASTATFADNRGNEELCHDVAESDLPIKRSLQKDPSSLKDLLNYIDESTSRSKIKAGLRDKAFWVFNRKDLPDDLFRKLAFLKCITEVR